MANRCDKVMSPILRGCHSFGFPAIFVVASVQWYDLPGLRWVLLVMEQIQAVFSLVEIAKETRIVLTTVLPRI